MKRLIIVGVLVLISQFCLSQIIVAPVGGTGFPTFQQFGTEKTTTNINGTVYPHYGLINARYPDTLSANLTSIRFIPGAQIMCGNDIYIRSYPLANYWFKLGTGAGTGTVTDITTGYGLTGGTITTTGSIAADTNHVTGLSTVLWRQKGIDSVASVVWKKAGNAGTNPGTPISPGTDFIGTTDSVGLYFKTNNTRRLFLPPNGINRSASAANKYLMIDTITKFMYYGDGGSGSTPTLQEVTDVGNTTTNDIIVDAGSGEIIKMYNDAGEGVLEISGGVGSSGADYRKTNFAWSQQTPSSKIQTIGRRATIANNSTIYFPDSSGTVALLSNIPASASPAGNYGNLQLNRNGAFKTPGSDSLSFSSGSGLSVKGGVNLSDNNAFKINGGNVVHYNSGTNNVTLAGGVGYNVLFSNSGNVFFGTGTNTYFSQGTGDLYMTSSAKLGVGTASPAASALVDITSTTKGFLPPRMTGTQAEAISSPAEGLMVYSTDGSGTTITSKGWWGYNGTTWQKLN